MPAQVEDVCENCGLPKRTTALVKEIIVVDVPCG